jgi:hypothetical protein
MSQNRADAAPPQSLYAVNAMPVTQSNPEPDPQPGTVLTASIETIDNDRADLLLGMGVVR